MQKASKKFLVGVLSFFIACCATLFAISALTQNTATAFADTTVVSLENGAYVRVADKENSGLKFKATVDQAQYDSLVATYGEGKVMTGIVIAPTSYISGAENFTFKGLSDYGVNCSYKDFVLEEGQAEITYSLVNILPKNYARNFSARAYVKILGEEISGYEHFNGANYAYSKYSWQNNSRNIYSVAYKYLASYPTGEELEIAKSFVDGVADVRTDNNGIPYVANNSDYYTSPYEVVSDGDYYYVQGDAELKAMLFNGERITSFKQAVDYGVVSNNESGEPIYGTIYRAVIPEYAPTLAYQGATFSGDNTVTLKGKGGTDGATYDDMGTNLGLTSYIQRLDNNYVAWSGDYGVGTKVSFVFKGNNMPQVMFFADKINGKMAGHTGEKINGVWTITNATKYQGLLLTNGFESSSAINNGGRKTFMAWGPYRFTPIESQFNASTAYSACTNSTKITYSDATFNSTTANIFTQTGLEEFANINPDIYLRYAVSTYAGADGFIWVQAYMYNDNTDQVLGYYNKATNLKVSDNYTGSIIAYATHKGHGVDTTFTYVEPPYQTSEIQNPVKYALQSQGLISNNNNTVVLEGKGGADMGTQFGVMRCIQALNNNYIAWKGDYGVGTFMQFTFKGNNMPQVCFFADQINGSMAGFTADNSSGAWKLTDTERYKGLLLTNGFESANAKNNGGRNTFIIWGPNRIVPDEDRLTGAYTYGLVEFPTGTRFQYSAGNANNIFTQQGLEEFANANPDTYLRYVVGTYNGSDGYVYVNAKMYDDNANTLLATYTAKTAYTIDESPSGNIIAFATVKGQGVKTKFTIDEPSEYGVEPIRETPEFNFFAYGGVGVYEQNVSSGAMENDFIDCGFNLSHISGYGLEADDSFIGSKAELAVREELSRGISKFLLKDDYFTDLVLANSAIDGTAIKNRLKQYIYYPGFMGVVMNDELNYTYTDRMGEVCKAIMQAAEELGTYDIFIHLNLLPNGSAWTAYSDTVTDVKLGYREYVANYLDATGISALSVDMYPFIYKFTTSVDSNGKTIYIPDTNTPRFFQGYFACIQVLAEECAKRNVEVTFVLQSTQDYREIYRELTQDQMLLQLNTALSMGVKNIAFFTYMPVPDTVVTEKPEYQQYSFVDRNGNKTELYYIVKQAIANVQKMSGALRGYQYSSAELFVDSTYTAYNNYVQWFTNTTSWNRVDDISAQGDAVLVTELNDNGDYAYCITNVADSAFGADTSIVTISFTNADNIVVYKDGERSVVPLDNGKYTVSLNNGEAVYLFPNII